MKTAIMEPYFFPYIGYWQLINSVDEFLIYDDVNYQKGGWISRNTRTMISCIPISLLEAEPEVIGEMEAKCTDKALFRSMRVL